MTEKKKTRRRHSIETKVSILREHHLNKTPISDLCDEHQLQPSSVYRWQHQLFEHAGVALEAAAAGKRKSTREEKLLRENEQLKAKLEKKNEVIAEISEEFVALKKALGGP
jgi:transposase-like protein